MRRKKEGGITPREAKKEQTLSLMESPVVTWPQTHTHTHTHTHTFKHKTRMHAHTHTYTHTHSITTTALAPYDLFVSEGAFSRERHLHSEDKQSLPLITRSRNINSFLSQTR